MGRYDVCGCEENMYEICIQNRKEEHILDEYRFICFQFNSVTILICGKQIVTRIIIFYLQNWKKCPLVIWTKLTMTTQETISETKLNSVSARVSRLLPEKIWHDATVWIQISKLFIWIRKFYKFVRDTVSSESF